MRKNRFMNHKGQAIIYISLVIVVLILVVGIAIDGGIGMAVKAKLHSAVDAATIAGGRAIGEGGSDQERIDIATAAAEKFFYANFPEDYLRTYGVEDDDLDIQVWPGVDESNVRDGTWHVRVTASATVKTFFLRLGGNKTFTATATAETLRRDLDLAFAADNTTSMRPVGPQVRSASKEFINRFTDADDRLALIKYGFGAEVPVPFDLANFTRGFPKGDCSSGAGVSGTVCGEIDNFYFIGPGNASIYTNSAEAFWHARNQLNSIPDDQRSSLRAIVFFTDGAPNTVSATYMFDGAPVAGSIRSGDGSSGNVQGLWRIDKVIQLLPGGYDCTDNENCGSWWNRYCCAWDCCDITAHVPTLPECYNPHGALDQESGGTCTAAGYKFRIWPQAQRGANPVRAAIPSNAPVTYANVNRVSRNLLEDMAEAARAEGIYVCTLGLGSNLTSGTGPDSEQGAIILKRMANTSDADTYNGNQPSCVYAFAADASQLDEAFNAIADYILRLTK